MKIPRFELERWQSVWENRVELNIAESGVLPLSPGELLETEAERAALLDARLGYPQTNGSEELRGRIAALYPGAKPENVLATCGTAEANFLVTWSLVEPGDEVVFMQPNYMQVGLLAEGLGAVVKPLWLREELGWAPDLEELKRLVTPRTRLIAVCNPNNPTGAVLTEAAMAEIAAVAAHGGAWLLVDEVYRGAEHDGGSTPPSAGLTPTFWGRYERVLCTAGLSKAYGLPGLRMGWVVGEPATIERLWCYHDYTAISVAALSDRLAAAALEPARREKILARTRRLLREHYPIVREWLPRHARIGHAGRLTHVPPHAGAIAWVGMPGVNTAEFCEELRERKSVLLVPGEQFALPGYVRVGFGYEGEKLRAALERVDALLGQTVQRT
ncbi:MAG: aminotransferase class I/II-fold pyridoxal phosphate-dependent enzyme [Candidatus Acidiferrales bacterium]